MVTAASLALCHCHLLLLCLLAVPFWVLRGGAHASFMWSSCYSFPACRPGCVSALPSPVPSNNLLFPRRLTLPPHLSLFPLHAVLLRTFRRSSGNLMVKIQKVLTPKHRLLLLSNILFFDLVLGVSMRQHIFGKSFTISCCLLLGILPSSC